MSPQPVTQSNGMGITDEQWADLDQQLSAEIAASQGPFNDQLRQDLRQQQFQLSLQRDIERSLTNNPVNVPMPIAQFDESLNSRPMSAGKTNIQPSLRSGDLLSAAMNEPYSFFGTSAVARLTGRSMDQVIADRLAQARAATTTGSMEAIGDIESILEFDPMARAFRGLYAGVEEINNLPSTLVDAFGNLADDARGYLSDALFGEDPLLGPHKAQSGLVRLFQEEGLAAGSVHLTRDVVTGLPVISTLAAGLETNNDPFAMARTLPGTLLALGLPSLAETRLAPIRSTPSDAGTTTVFRVEGTPNTRLLISETGEVTITGDQTLFLNFGQTTRAEEFLTRRISQGMESPTVKQFSVPTSYVEELRRSAVFESEVHLFPDAPIRVDTAFPDQFGIRPQHFQRLQEVIVPNSGKIGW